MRASQLLAGVSCIVALIALVVLRGRHRGEPELGWVTPAAAQATQADAAAGTPETPDTSEPADAEQSLQQSASKTSADAEKPAGGEDTPAQKEEQHGAD